MSIAHRKVTIIGAGYVGSTSAYALIAARLANEIALLDVNTALARAQAMDLQHAMPFHAPLSVHAGTYADIRDSAIVIIAAGANQKPGETRLDLIKKNTAIMHEIGSNIFRMNKSAVVLVVTNPVDILTYQLIKRYPQHRPRIFGSGTVLDTARLRFLIGAFTQVNPSSVHAYICGEHGDSEFPLWSTANIGQVPILDYPGCSRKKLDALFEQARHAAYAIIEGKQATYYAIASGVAHIVDAVFNDKNDVLPVSHLLTNYHGISDVALSVPAIVGSKGIRAQMKLDLRAEEVKRLRASAQKLKAAAHHIV